MKLMSQPATWQRGLGDGFTIAVEFVVTSVIFALGGYALDSWLGTKPVLLLTLGIIGLVGCAVRTYYAYLAQSAREEEGKPWTRSRR